VERRFFNPSQPQTLQGAVFLLYANVALALLYRTGGEGVFALATYSLSRGSVGVHASTVIGNLVSIAVVLGSAAAGYLIANEKRLGWRIGVVVAVAPLIALLILLVLGYPERLGIGDAITIKLLFDIALVVLLVHDQSRAYEKIWFK